MKIKGNSSIIGGVLFFVVGLFVLIYPDMIVKFVSYFVGGCLIAYGLYKSINYYVQDKRHGIVNQNELGFGVTLVVLGILLVCLAGTIEFLTRVVIGAYLFIAGITRIMSSFYTTDRGNKFITLLVVGVILIAGGLYTIAEANLPFQILGIFMMVYGIIDFISYFVYKDSKEEGKEIKEVELIEEKIEKEDSDTTEK